MHVCTAGISVCNEKKKIQWKWILLEGRCTVSCRGDSYVERVKIECCLVADPFHGIWIGVLESRDRVLDHPVLVPSRRMDEWTVLAEKQTAVATQQLKELEHRPSEGTVQCASTPIGWVFIPLVLLVFSAEVKQCCRMWEVKKRKGWVLCFHTADVVGMGDWSTSEAKT